MNFQVPQFIEVEDRIFGPLTLKQFIYVVGGAGLSFVLYVYLPFYLAVPLIAAVAGLALLLAFYRYNERPFANLLESAFRYLLANKLYIWRKAPPAASQSQTSAIIPDTAAVGPSRPSGTVAPAPRLSHSRLKDLAWSLDIKDIIR